MRRIGIAAALVLGAGLVGAPPAAATPNTYLGSLHTVSTIASTVPTSGAADVNPYGVAVVPVSEGDLVAGQTLVSNFNNAMNLQGTGTSIVEVSPGGTQRLFARVESADCPGGVGLTTALAVFRSGWVIVGSLPTTDGTAATAEAGCLLVLDDTGRLVETLSGGPINGPWDMTALDGGTSGTLFVTNVLNGTVAAGGAVVDHGTVIRIPVSFAGATPAFGSPVTIGSGFGERTDPAALVVGPTGVALTSGGTLFVADTVGNRITAISAALTRTSSAGVGSVVSIGGALNSPLGLATAPNGDLLTVNAGDGRIVELRPSGAQVASRILDNSGHPHGGGALFGLAIPSAQTGVQFVDDVTNTLNLLH
jgi:hypothetical protein